MADLSSYINIGANTANFVGDITATNLGNVASVDLNGNASTVLAGDGSWIAQSGGGASTYIQNGNSAVAILSSGSNVTVTVNATPVANFSDSQLSVVGAVIGNGNVSGSNITTGGVVSATGNVRGANLNTAGDLSVTGNATISGTSSNVTRRAFGLVAADTNVTLDDLSANVSSSTSQLGLSTSGSWQGTGYTETFTSGTPSVQQWVNLPLSSGFSTASGAMNSQGQGCRCVITDQTPTAKMYEINVIRSGTTGALWNISIERLV